MENKLTKEEHLKMALDNIDQVLAAYSASREIHIALAGNLKLIKDEIFKPKYPLKEASVEEANEIS